MKKCIIIMVIISMFTLTGCVKEYKPNIEQSERLAEYMASMILSYDKSYIPTLIDISEKLKKQEDKAKLNEGTKENLGPTPIVKDMDVIKKENPGINKVLGLADLEIEYIGYQLYNSFPEKELNPYFTIEPREGYQLMVATFLLVNSTDKVVVANLSKSNINYQLDVNVGRIYKPLLTFLENDLQHMDQINANSNKTVVLVFEISKEKDISDINLIVSNNNLTEIIEIK